MQKTVTSNSTVVNEKSTSGLSLKKVGELLNQTDMNSSKENYGKRSLSPIATQRTIVINRTSNQVPMSVVNKNFSYESMSSPMGSNVTGEIGQFKRVREKDKKDMQNLNEKLAGYIEQVIRLMLRKK